MIISFDAVAFQDYNECVNIGELIRDIRRDPFKGIGKPDYQDAG